MYWEKFLVLVQTVQTQIRQLLKQQYDQDLDYSQFLLQQGTLDNADIADVEWVYRPYMDTAMKKFLAD